MDNPRRIPLDRKPSMMPCEPAIGLSGTTGGPARQTFALLHLLSGKESAFSS